MAIVLTLVIVTSNAAAGTMPVYAQERTETETAAEENAAETDNSGNETDAAVSDSEGSSYEEDAAVESGTQTADEETENSAGADSDVTEDSTAAEGSSANDPEDLSASDPEEDEGIQEDAADPEQANSGETEGEEAADSGEEEAAPEEEAGQGTTTVMPGNGTEDSSGSVETAAEASEEAASEEQGKDSSKASNVPGPIRKTLKTGEVIEDSCVEGDEQYWYKFVAPKTGYYKLNFEYSEGGYAQILIGSDTEDEDVWGEKSRKLTGGVTYYIHLWYMSYRTSVVFSIEQAEFGAMITSDQIFTVSDGDKVTMKVDAYSSGNLTYRWYMGDQLISGQTKAIYTFSASKTSKYTCKVSDGNESVELWFSVKINNAFRVYAKEKDSLPSSLTIYAGPGDSIKLQTVAQGKVTTGVTYQWYCEDKAISGKTSSSLTVKANNNTTYRCRAKDKYGNYAAASFFLIIENDLSVKGIGPVNEYGYVTTSAKVGEPVTLRVKASAKDTSGLHYEWDYDYSEDLGTDSPNCVLDTPAGGLYSCRVSDRYGNSEEVYFEVSINNELHAFPYGIHWEQGLSTSFVTIADPNDARVYAEAIDKTDLRYSWYEIDKTRDELILIEGEDSDRLHDPKWKYKYLRCVVTDRYQNEAHVSFDIVPEFKIVNPAVNKEYQEAGFEWYNNEEVLFLKKGQKKTLTVVVDNSGPDTLTCKWYKDKDGKRTAIADAAGLSYAFTASEDCTYICRVSNSEGQYKEAGFYIRLNDKFYIYPQGAGTESDGYKATGADYVLKPGASKTLSVIVQNAGKETIKYQWYIQVETAYRTYWKAISGKTTSKCIVKGGKPAYYTYYKCTAKDSKGNTAEAYFYVRCNHFSMEPTISWYMSEDMAEKTAVVNKTFGKNCVLKTKVSGDDTAGVTYKWYTRNRITWTTKPVSGAAKSSLTVSKDTNIDYICYASDKYGNMDACVFSVNSNHLRAYATVPGINETLSDTASAICGIGQSVQLKAVVKADNTSGIKYSWYDENGKLLSSNGASIEVVPEENKSYYCEASDSNGNKAIAHWSIKIDSGLSVRPIAEGAGEIPCEYEEDTCLMVFAGEIGRSGAEADEESNGGEESAGETDSVTLIAQTTWNGESGLQYFWQKRSLEDFNMKNGWIYLDEDAGQITVEPDSDTRYECTVMDPFGNSRAVIFDVYASVRKGLEELNAETVLAEKTGYTGTAREPAITVTAEGRTLIKRIDYSVEYTDNVETGQAKVTVKGRGRYTGELIRSFEIVKGTQTLRGIPATTKLVSKKTLQLKVTGNKGTLKYSSSAPGIAKVSTSGLITAVAPGTAQIKVRAEATDHYNVSEKVIKVIVLPAAPASLKAVSLAKGNKLSWSKVPGANGYVVYRGTAKIATITKGTTVTFTDTAANTNGAGYIYKVYAKAGSGVSTAYAKVTTYHMARPAISKLSSSDKGKASVTWNRNSKGSGYQIQYSTSSSYKSSKTAAVAKNSTVTKTVGSLRSGKVYYFRVRSYKTVSGVRYYSAWSATKKIRVK